MASSSTLRALAIAASAGGNYFGQIHAESMRTKRLAESRVAAEAQYQRGRTDKKADLAEARAYQEGKANSKPSQQQEKLDLLKSDPNAYARLYGRPESSKPSALQEKVSLFKNDRETYGAIFGKESDKPSALQEKLTLLRENPEEYARMFGKEEATKMSALEEKLSLLRNSPEEFERIFGKDEAAKMSALEEKVALYKNDPETYGAIFDKGAAGDTTEEAITRDTGISRAQGAAKRNDVVLEAGLGARANTRRYETMLKLLDNVDTGTFAETLTGVKKAAEGLGIDVDTRGLANAEQLMVLLGDEVMSRISETKGAVSEKEMELFQTFSAGFGKTVEGNRQIIRYKLAQSKRNVALGDTVLKMRKADAPARDIEGAIYSYINDPKNDLSTYLQEPEAPPAVEPVNNRVGRTSRSQRLAEIRARNAGR